jgi:hypothetical protein
LNELRLDKNEVSFAIDFQAPCPKPVDSSGHQVEKFFLTFYIIVINCVYVEISDLNLEMLENFHEI